ELATIGLADQLVLRAAQLQDVTEGTDPGQGRGDGAHRRARRPRSEEAKLDPLHLVSTGFQDLGVQPGHSRLADPVEQPLDARIVLICPDLTGPYGAVIEEMLLDVVGDDHRAVYRGFRAELAAPHDMVSAVLPGSVHQVMHMFRPDADRQDEGVRGSAAGLPD